jgi:hypothetical protein
LKPDRIRELLKQGRTDELWQYYMGYLDLDLAGFMQIQRRKVMEHVAWLYPSELGRKLLGPKRPASVEEFRASVPLTNYAAYAPFLLERSSQDLPEEALYWMCTSGRGGEYSKKWAPIFREGYEDAMHVGCVRDLALSSARWKGDFRIEAGDKLPYMWAPCPYGLGYMAKAIAEGLPIVTLPSEEEGAKLSFEERINRAMQMAMRDGIDYFYGLSSVLMRVGERFAQGSGQKRKFSRSMLHPQVLLRLLRGTIASKLAGRPMYPKDLWRVKGICAAGTDASIFAERIHEYWGVWPLDSYGTSEFGAIASQVWDHQALTPFPDPVFYEFIPWDEHVRSREEPGYVPRTVLMDEVEAGQTYELVLTSLKVSVFVRYRVGDMVRITAVRNEALGINLPQFVVEGRCDDLLDLAGFTRLTEKSIWTAIARSGVSYEEWTCRKELEGGQPILRMWIELKDGARSAEEVRSAIHETLSGMDSDYRDLEKMLGYNPLRISLLSNGTFQRYALDRQAAGAEPAHLKPRHFMRSQEVLDRLLEMHARGNDHH